MMWKEIESLTLAVLPNSDRRRDLSINEIELQNRFLNPTKLSSAGQSRPRKQRFNSEELKFIELHFNDCVAHIKEYQKNHWVAFAWLVATQVGTTWGILNLNANGYSSSILMFSFFLVPVLVGLFGLSFLNEISIALERNRKHLDTLRILMGGFIIDMYMNIAGSADEKTRSLSSGRHVDKRRMEIAMHVLFILVSIICALILFLRFYDLVSIKGKS